MAEIKKFKLFEAISIEVIVMSMIFLSSLFSFAYIVNQVIFNDQRAFDNKVFEYLSFYSNRDFVSAMEIFTFFGSQTFLIPAYIILVIILFIYKKYRFCIDILVIALSSTGVMLLLKEIFHRQRLNCLY